MKKIPLSVLCIIVLLFTGCGYHLGAIPPAGVTSIYIPMLENTTHRQEVTSDVTSGIIKRFKTDGTIKVTNKESADAILYGRITGYKTEAILFDSQDVGEEFRVIITVDVTLVSSDTEKVLFTGTNIDGQAITQVTFNQVEAEKRVFPIIIKDLSTNVVEAVLESAW